MIGEILIGLIWYVIITCIIYKIYTDVEHVTYGPWWILLWPLLPAVLLLALIGWLGANIYYWIRGDWYE